MPIFDQEFVFRIHKEYFPSNNSNNEEKKNKGTKWTIHQKSMQIGNKNIKICIYLAITEMQIKTIMEYHNPSISMAKSENLMVPSAGKGVKLLLHTAGGNVKCHKHFGRHFDSFLKDWMLYLQPNPTIAPLYTYSKEMKIYNSKSIIEITKIPSPDEWANTLQHMYPMEFNFSVTTNELLIYTA